MNRESSTIVKRALLELFYRRREQELDQLAPRVLVLLAFHWIGMDRGFAAIETLQTHTDRLIVWADKELAEQYGVQEIIRKAATDHIIWYDRWKDSVKDSFDYLLIPVLSFSLASRIARLDDANPFVRLIFWALCSGKPVAALADGIDPHQSSWGDQGFRHSTPALKQELRSLLETLKGFGIRLLKPEEIPAWLMPQSETKRQVLTAEDILAAHAAGQSEIRITRNAIVTPLAADLANEYRVKIDMK
jgi:hypothetical protein